MTSKLAEAIYQCEHMAKWAGNGYVVYNPHNKPIDELPFILGFNNGGSSGMESAIAISEDGVILGTHICSSEVYMPYDLGLIEGARLDRHERYREHYPNGYKMDFVSYDEAKVDVRLKIAIKFHELQKLLKDKNDEV